MGEYHGNIMGIFIEKSWEYHGLIRVIDGYEW